jgi:hypothetical protein
VLAIHTRFNDEDLGWKRDLMDFHTLLPFPSHLRVTLPTPQARRLDSWPCTAAGYLGSGNVDKCKILIRAVSSFHLLSLSLPGLC